MKLLKSGPSSLQCGVLYNFEVLVLEYCHCHGVADIFSDSNSYKLFFRFRFYILKTYDKLIKVQHVVKD